MPPGGALHRLREPGTCDPSIGGSWGLACTGAPGEPCTSDPLTHRSVITIGHGVFGDHGVSDHRPESRSMRTEMRRTAVASGFRVSGGLYAFVLVELNGEDFRKRPIQDRSSVRLFAKFIQPFAGCYDLTNERLNFPHADKDRHPRWQMMKTKRASIPLSSCFPPQENKANADSPEIAR